MAAAAVWPVRGWSDGGGARSAHPAGERIINVLELAQLRNLLITCCTDTKSQNELLICSRLIICDKMRLNSGVFE
jgi:hypothetical protein